MADKSQIPDAHFYKAFQMVGEFLFNWASMESNLNSLIGQLLQLKISQEFVVTHVVTHNITLFDKLAIAGAAMDLIRLSADEKKRFRKILTKIGDKSTTRNMVAHSPFAATKDGKAVQFYRSFVRGKIGDPKPVKWTVRELGEQCGAIEALEKGIMEMKAAAKTKIDLDRLVAALLEPTLTPFAQGLRDAQSRQPLGLFGFPPGTSIPQTSSQNPQEPEKK